MESLARSNQVQSLAAPTLATVHGKPTSCCIGGEIPFLTAAANGTVSVAWKQYGTRLEVLPTLLAGGQIRLAFDCNVTEIDDTRATTVAGGTVPALRVRWSTSVVELASGQTALVELPDAPPNENQKNTLLILAKAEKTGPR